MLLGNNMFDVKPVKRLVVLMDSAVFASMAGAPPD
jgi:hypothetical protein